MPTNTGRESWGPRAAACRATVSITPCLRKLPMPRITAARANAQRERILDAALTCFAREGFHAATMQDIVAESGLSPGAIYGYFKGKTDVVMAIASERHAMERRRMEHALAASDLDSSLARLTEAFVLGLRD